MKILGVQCNVCMESKYFWPFRLLDIRSEWFLVHSNNDRMIPSAFTASIRSLVGIMV